MQKLESREVGAHAHKGTVPTRKTNPRESNVGGHGHICGGSHPPPLSPHLCPWHREPPPHPQSTPHTLLTLPNSVPSEHYSCYTHFTDWQVLRSQRDFLSGSSGKEPACQCRRHKRHRFNPWVGKIPLEEGMATNSSIPPWRIPMDRRAWKATVHGVTQSRTRLKRLSTHARRSQQGNPHRAASLLPSGEGLQSVSLSV